MTEYEKSALLQNLKDCGGEPLVGQFSDALEHGSKKEALALLARHRSELLAQFHHCDKCISCLDYLVRQVEKTEP